jgi:hypothetical protein
MDHTESNDEYTPEEAQRRADEMLKRMLNTPPKRHDEMKKEGKVTSRKSRAKPESA